MYPLLQSGPLYYFYCDTISESPARVVGQGRDAQSPRRAGTGLELVIKRGACAEGQAEKVAQDGTQRWAPGLC